MSGMKLSVRDLRDGVLLVEYPEASEQAANLAAVGLGRRLRARAQPGIFDAVPAARTLLVVFDPALLTRGCLAEEIERVSALEVDEKGVGRLVRVPVVYGGADGPDLAELAGAAGVSAGEFARRHAAAEYRVAFIGFAPGFPYLVGLPRELHAARLASPRPRVPAGSVAIGGPYSGIYPAATPGGWRLIGRTRARLFDPYADPPALFAAGDRVAFEVGEPDSLPGATDGQRAPVGGRPVLRLLTAGVFASIQGAPRLGLGSLGVPAGGAMDTRALAHANVLVGNAPGACALEIALVGPDLEALDAVTAAIAGADLAAEWNGRPAPFGEPFSIAAGGRLRFRRARRGARAYLAVRGGFEPLTQTRRLEAGESIALDSRPAAPLQTRPRPIDLLKEPRLRVVLGPQADSFAAAQIERFFGTGWRVSAMSDRRGLRLEGERLEHVWAPEIPPEGAVTGSIQVPGSGLPIVLGPDGPVTGGYPKIATVIGPDLPLLGQAAPGALLRFTAVSLEEALRLGQEYD